MSTYPDLKNEAELLKIKTKDDQLKEVQYTQEKYDHENILKSLKVDNEYFKKKYKNLNKKKVLLIITEILFGAGSAVGSSSMALINPGAGIVISSSTALLTSIAILITNEYISKLKIRYTKLRDWIHVITLLYEQALKKSMVDKKIDEKEAQELKKIYNHYIDKRSEIMRNTSSEVEDVFGDVISKDKFSQEQITKIHNFFSKNNVILNINIKINLFKPRKKKNIDMLPSAPPYYE